MLRTLLKGTIILTFTGILTRLIGFVYKIYLSNILGAHMLGIYQLIFPVFHICFTLFASGIQTAISQIIASKSDSIATVKKILFTAILISLIVSGTLSVTTFFASDYIALYCLGEYECTKLIKILAFAYPFCGVSACINGCYYGFKKASVPAVSQLLEQLARVAFVYVVAIIISGSNPKLMCAIAVCGMGVGECVSMIYSVIRILIFFKKDVSNCQISETSAITKQILKISVPLTGNRLVIALLSSVETILIPCMLKKYGMSAKEALSVYGVLTGMAMPFILFPSTITNSLSVLLLPTISEANSNKTGVRKISNICILCSVAWGIVSTIVFLTFGADLGAKVFNSESVGLFIEMLALLCPFMFTATTLTSIINGLGYTHTTFFITIIGLTIRILFTVKLVPLQGIEGYLISLIISQLVITVFSYYYYKRLTCKEVNL